MELGGKPKNKIVSKSKNEIVGKRIRDLREVNDVKQKELADILGFSERNLGHIESGDRGLTIENAEIIADHFHCTLDYIYRGKVKIELGLNPVCQLVSDAMANIKDDAKKEWYIKTIIDLSHLFMNPDEK